MSNETLIINAPAKVNLCLAVHYPPHDGYHQVDSVFQELDLCDVVRASVLDRYSSPVTPQAYATQARTVPTPQLSTALGTPVVLDCAVPGLDPRDNLVFRAVDLAELACDIPAAPAGSMLVIDVEKHIPAGGGLGGGSSDAAAMLKAYAQLTGIEPFDKRLLAAARELGADVAFFMYGGCALMRDRGDVLDRRLPRLALPIVLMGDAQGMSTAAIYRAFDDDPPALPDADALATALETNQRGRRCLVENDQEGQASPGTASALAAIAALCANNLGPIACAQSARLQARLDVAHAHPDVLNALVSGSGSTSFAICPDLQAAQRFASDIAPLCDWTHICLP